MATAEETAAATDNVALTAEMDHTEMVVRGNNGDVLVCGRERLEELARGQHVDWRKRLTTAKKATAEGETTKEETAEGEIAEEATTEKATTKKATTKNAAAEGESRT